MIIILSIPNRFKNFFSLEDSLVNLQLSGYQKSHRTLHMLLYYILWNINVNKLMSLIICVMLSDVKLQYLTWPQQNKPLTTNYKVV